MWNINQLPNCTRVHFRCFNSGHTHQHSSLPIEYIWFTSKADRDVRIGKLFSGMTITSWLSCYARFWFWFISSFHLYRILNFDFNSINIVYIVYYNIGKLYHTPTWMPYLYLGYTLYSPHRELPGTSWYHWYLLPLVSPTAPLAPSASLLDPLGDGSPGGPLWPRRGHFPPGKPSVDWSPNGTPEQVNKQCIKHQIKYLIGFPAMFIRCQNVAWLYIMLKCYQIFILMFNKMIC